MPDPTTYSYTAAAVPREGEGVGSHYAYEAEFQRAAAWREEALRCQAKLAEQDKVIRMRADEADARRSWLARIEAAAKDVFALRYMACLTLDTAIYKLWLATEGTPSIYPPCVVPTAPAPNQETDVASLHAELARKFAERIKEVAKLQAELADVKAECCRLACRNGDLEALAEVVGRLIPRFCVERGCGPIRELTEAFTAMRTKEAQ